MPKASGADAASPKPADSSAPDPVATQPAQPPADASTDPPSKDAAPVTGRWEYVSDDPLIYTNVPVTPARGDVVAWPDEPPSADGRWKPTDAKVTRQPDNAPKEG